MLCRRHQSKLLTVLWLALACFLLTLSAPAQAADGPQKRVLVSYGLRKEATATLIVEKVLQKTISKSLAENLDYYAEYIDVARFPDEDYQSALRDFLRRKYKGVTFDLVIALNDTALQLVAKYGAELFPGTPIVFQGAKGHGLGPNFIGLLYQLDLKGTLDLALRLQPGTRQVFVVSGASEFDKFYGALSRRQFQAFRGRLDLTYLVGLVMEDLKKTLAHLPGDSISYYLSISEDGAESRYLPPDALDAFYPAANAPIYGWYEGFMDHGIVGGSLLSSELLAQQTAGLALRLLRGERPESISTTEIEGRVVEFDWRQLRRWGISEDRLPPGSVVRFKEPAFWERYRWRVAAVLTLVVAQASLIAFLLLERSRRQRATQGLKKSEEQFRLLFENSKDAIFMTDDGGNYLRVNQAACELFGYKRERLMQMKVADLPSADAPETAVRYQRYLETGSETGEWVFVRQDGERRTIQYRASRLAPGLHLSIARDVTPQKQAEEALRESEARHRQMFERNRTVKLLIDPSSGEIVDANPAAAAFYGYSLEALRRMKITDLNTLGPGQITVEMTRAAAGEQYFFTFRHRVASGEVRDVEVHSSPLDVGGRRLLYSIIHDVTERRRTEERLRRFFELPLVGMALTSPDQRFLRVNQRLCELLGYPEPELTGMSWAEVTHPEDRAENDRLLGRAVRGEIEGYRLDKRFIRRDGRVVYASISARCMRREDGAADQLVLVVEDITDRKRAEDELRQLTARLLRLQDEERRRIARELHDTTAQNVLALTLGLAEMQKRSGDFPASVKETLSRCQALGRQSLQELRTLSYLLHPPLLDEAGLASAVRWYADGFGKRSGIEVDLVTPRGLGRLPPEVEIALFRVVQECLTNIYRHSGSETAHIRLERQNGHAVLVVKDRGRGMEAVGGGEASKNGRALGVGILGMRQRLLQLGGKLEVNSDGRGTTVTAVVPLGQGKEGDAHPAG